MESGDWIAAGMAAERDDKRTGGKGKVEKGERMGRGWGEDDETMATDMRGEQHIKTN